MSELENGMVITNESNNQAQFDRDNCFIVLHYNRDNETDLYVAFFYCTGSSSSDGTNENLRGSGRGKRLMLDAMIYIQQKYDKLENVSIYPMPTFDPYQIEQIYKAVSHKYIESNEEMRTTFEDQVMYNSDYEHWIRHNHYYDIQRDVDIKVEEHKKEQLQKLARYYKSLGFSGDGALLYGNLSEIIKTISDSMTGNGNGKGKGFKKSIKSIKRRKSIRKSSKKRQNKKRE